MPRFGFEQKDLKGVLTAGLWLVERVAEVASSSQVSLDQLSLGMGVGGPPYDFPCQGGNALVAVGDFEVALP